MDRFKIQDLSGEERCSKPVLDFLSTTCAGTPKAGPSPGRGKRTERGVEVGTPGVERKGGGEEARG